VTYELRGLLIGEVFVTLFVLAGLYANRTVTWWLFQLRRRANMRLGGAEASSEEASSDPTAARGALGMSAWQAFLNDADFLRANEVTPSELEALKHASFMGDVTSKEDLMHILDAIRSPVRRS
jgi:hypothetical protein